MLNPLICASCGEPNDRARPDCGNCGTSLGPVNVNLLSDTYFAEGLEQRYRAIRADKEPEHLRVLEAFEQAVSSRAVAVINMDMKLLLQLVQNKDAYLPYQRAVEEGKRYKAAFLNDQHRVVVESAIYGFSGREIVYAALSLDEKGLKSYGNTTLVLKTASIKNRTSLFERNTYALFKDWVQAGWTVAGQYIPTGFGCAWNQRTQLAVIKCAKDLNISAEEVIFAKLMLSSAEERSEDEFIELHVYKSIGIQAIEKVNFEEAASLNTFEALQRDILKDLLQEKGIIVS